MTDAPETMMGIAELAERAGVTARTIRYYVAEGLLPAPGGRGQRRAYGQEHLDRLEMIHELKVAYLPLHEIRRRLEQTPPAPPSPLRGANIGFADIISLPPERGSSSAVSRQEGTAGGGSGMVSGAGSAPVAAVSDQGRPPIGFRGPLEVGRIEIFDPPETVWRRVNLASGVELHYRETDDPRLAEAIQRLIHEAGAILDASQDAPRQEAQRGKPGERDRGWQR